jgi:hypothetical protein
MKTSLEQTLSDAVALLRELPRQRSSVESAHARFKQFQNAHRGVRCDLLVDQPPASDKADYDILLGAPDEAEDLLYGIESAPCLTAFEGS